MTKINIKGLLQKNGIYWVPSKFDYCPEMDEFGRSWYINGQYALRGGTIFAVRRSSVQREPGKYWYTPYVKVRGFVIRGEAKGTLVAAKRIAVRLALREQVLVELNND